MWAIPEEDHYDTAGIDCATCRASVASCPEELSSQAYRDMALQDRPERWQCCR